jgi:hypothetical protein
MQIDNLNIKQITTKHKYIMFSINLNNNIYYFPTIDMARNVHYSLANFIKNWNCNYNLINCIGKRQLTKFDDKYFIDCCGNKLNIEKFIKYSTELTNLNSNPQLPKDKYDEFTLATLKIFNISPRIKRTIFSYNPFAPKYIKSDEKTIRELNMVLIPENFI